MDRAVASIIQVPLAFTHITPSRFREMLPPALNCKRIPPEPRPQAPAGPASRIVRAGHADFAIMNIQSVKACF